MIPLSAWAYDEMVKWYPDDFVALWFFRYSEVKY